jgi:acyl-CoA thioesterase I
MKTLVLLWLAIFVMAMSSAPEKINKQAERIRYVAIGDSYSIGEGASPNESWPAVLTRHLNEQGLHLDLVANPSHTGWTAQQAIDHELPIFAAAKPNFATLQIGVNDWVQAVDAETFRKRFVTLVDRMLEMLPNKDRLLIVTIPDFGVTPAGPRYAGGRNISNGILSFNKIIAEEARNRGLRVVDVFPLSKKNGQRALISRSGWLASFRERIRRVGEDYFSSWTGVAHEVN